MAIRLTFWKGGYLGGICDELHERSGPELLSANGQKTTINAAGDRTTVPLGKSATLRPLGEWNDYRITAKGQQIVLEINGAKSTELVDQEEGHFDLSGFLGLQLRAGEPMIVQFKDIDLKKL
ncbi:family 16 glycoside hydrolase [Planctomicrobium sp. SH668]|uniref:family 16 glycoside hydrolase n=1 Tax=Planctomicrobium sp. SH668 TaxID=3448126 RepID=UPI003F5C1B6B